MHFRLHTAALLIAATLFLAPSAQAICGGDAVITAEANADPTGPAWTYTVTISWFFVQGVQGWLLPLDSVGGSCACSDFSAAITMNDPAGYSDGLPDGCSVPYLGRLECDGHPLSGMTGIIMSFTADLGGGCTLGDAGTAVLTFGSDLPPAPIAEDYNFASFGVTGGLCGMPMTGVFPSMACDPVDADKTSWGALKSYYR